MNESCELLIAQPFVADCGSVQSCPIDQLTKLTDGGACWFSSRSRSGSQWEFGPLFVVSAVCSQPWHVHGRTCSQAIGLDKESQEQGALTHICSHSQSYNFFTTDCLCQKLSIYFAITHYTYSLSSQSSHIYFVRFVWFAACLTRCALTGHWDSRCWGRPRVHRMQCFLASYFTLWGLSLQRHLLQFVASSQIGLKQISASCLPLFS